MHEFIAQNWKLILIVGVIVLGALGYIEKMFNLQWSRKWLIGLLLLFLLISVGQIKLFIDSDKQVNSLESQLEDSQKRLEDLKKKTAPRTLTRSQENKMVEQLESIEKRCAVIVACRAFDTESCNFAQGLASTFRTANWEVGRVNKSFLDDIEGDVTIVRTADEQKEVVSQLVNLLNNVGILCIPQEVRKNSMSGIKENTIYVIVGTKKG